MYGQTLKKRFTHIWSWKTVMVDCKACHYCCQIMRIFSPFCIVNRNNSTVYEQHKVADKTAQQVPYQEWPATRNLIPRSAISA
jgi:hypothetical protein